MSFWIGFIIGIFVGGSIGGLTMSLMIIGKQTDEEKEPKLCICCEEITEENAHLHKNCGK